MSSQRHPAEARAAEIWPVGAPPRVAARLRAAPDGPVRVLHRTPQASYVEVGGRCVGITGPGAVALPVALHASRALPPLGDELTARVEGGVLHWGRWALVPGRLVDVRAPRIDPDRVAATETVQPLADDLPTHVDAASVARLVGRGEGLTPLGDDVVCGWLAFHRAARIPTPAVDAAVRLLLARTTTLSATLLDAALAGEVCPPVGVYLRALGSADAADAAEARARLVRVGHTSGAGLAHGVDLAATEIAPGRRAA